MKCHRAGSCWTRSQCACQSIWSHVPRIADSPMATRLLPCNGLLITVFLMTILSVNHQSITSYNAESLPDDIYMLLTFHMKIDWSDTTSADQSGDVYNPWAHSFSKIGNKWHHKFKEEYKLNFSVMVYSGLNGKRLMVIDIENCIIVIGKHS